jgi:hypothetical protein
MIKPPSIESVFHHIQDQVPDGWFTRQQLQAHWKLSQSQTVNIIREQIALGKAEMQFFRIACLGRTPIKIQHYKFK